jgi:hypothetical protein
MAVNAQKLLPPARLTAGERMAAAYDKKIDDLLNLKIKKKLINVEKIVNKTKKVKEKTKKDKKVNKENEKRKVKEDRLEKQKPQEIKKLNLPNLPKTGFLDSVQNFLGYTFLGYLFTNYGDNLPQLKKVVNLLPAAVDTFGKVLIGTLDFSSALIAGGYKAKDELSKQIKSLGGEDAQKTFDQFTTDFRDMINSIMTLGLVQPKQPVPQKTNGGLVTKMVVGGNVTRMGRPVGGEITREIKATPERVALPIVYRQETQPGKDIGGQEKIEKVFPSSKNKSEPGPLNTLMSTSSSLSKVPFIGPLMAAAVDIAMGQKPDKRVYQSFGQSLAYLIGPSIENQSSQAVNNIASTVLAMAGGGITRQIQRKGISQEQFGVVLGKIFEQSVESRLANIFSEILKTKNTEATPTTPFPGAVSVSSESPDFWLLAVAALMENSDPQGAADVAQVIYNRVASPAWPGDIRSVILEDNGGQFQPVRDYGSISDWKSIKDKESALKFIQKHGRRQDQLEQVAAALLDANRQRSAASFVGPRDSFRAEAYERQNNHLANETEQTRHGHTFGFEPGGAQIAKFKAGQLRPAQVSASTRGTVSSTTAPLTGENGRLKPEQLKQVGVLYGGADYQDWYGNNAMLLKAGNCADAFLAAKAQAAKEGVTILITSAYRSLAHQTAIQGKYNVVAAPGQSRHGEGTALDIQDGTRGWDWFVKNGPAYGWFYMKIPGDPVHFEYMGGWKPSTTSPTKSQAVSSSFEPSAPTANIASSIPRVSNAANQIAMTPAYDDVETVFILKEKIVLKEVASQSTSYNNQGTIAFPGVNSTIPTLVG